MRLRSTISSALMAALAPLLSMIARPRFRVYKMAIYSVLMTLADKMLTSASNRLILLMIRPHVGLK